MSEEYLEEWDWTTGNPTGRRVLRTMAHREGIPHEGVHLWIISVIDKTVHLLFQRRAATKAQYPGYLDITVGGHVPFGLKDGKIEKEAFEELGLELELPALTDLGWFRYEEEVPERDLYHREFQHVWLLRDDRPLDGYRFNDGEVDALAAVPLPAFKEILKGKDSCPGIFFDGKTVMSRQFLRDEFHPLFFTGKMDGYLSGVIAKIESFSEV